MAQHPHVGGWVSRGAPLLAISPWAEANRGDPTFAAQTSIARFIKDNWSLGRIGGGSLDTVTNLIDNMFNFIPSTPPNPQP